jgi:hypothetical protein
MPVERYSSIDRMEGGANRVGDSSEALDRMLELISFIPSNCPPLYRPGTYRFRSLEEANEAREMASAQRMRALGAIREAP